MADRCPQAHRRSKDYPYGRADALALRCHGSVTGDHAYRFAFCAPQETSLPGLIGGVESFAPEARWMAKPIKITVRGTATDGDDAPTVEDLLAQIQDLVDVLHGVEAAIAGEGKIELVWRVTDATKNSPLTFEVTPFPKSYAMNIDQRADEVIGVAAKGLDQISKGGERPIYFTDAVVDRAERMHCRLTNGLAEMNVDFSNYESAPQLKLNRISAREFVEKISRLKKPAPAPHREIGSIEGFIAKVELDGFNRPIVWLRARLDRQLVKCVARDKALDRIGHLEVMEILRGLRVRVHGLIHYKDAEQVASIDVEGVHIFDPDRELPNPDDILDPGFTGGIEASAYLDALRGDA
jgi:hypothetical protein